MRLIRRIISADAGAKIRELEKIHQKIIIVDNSKYMVGSFNWLSTSRKTNLEEPHYQDNRTIVYSGPRVSQMIEEELKYISYREKSF
ncbi:MAG: PLD-like domain [Deltaproteobacteria bacterium]|nr:PLD-like domain [Deltaproteobacteria bacterium]